jgi:manganese/zinc/iron transport system substrate-binding protein
MTRRIFVLFVLAMAGSGCRNATTSSDDRVRIVCTTSIIADAVQRVGGERVAVECLMGPGVDPHRYTPTAGDISKLASAKVIFYHGLHLEGKMVDILRQARAGQTAVAVAEVIDTKKLRHADDEHDPHVWFDPQLWIECVREIEKRLVAVDPAHADEFKNRSDEFVTEIQLTDRELQTTVEQLPKAKRILVTSHDAFGYFGARYHFEVRGLQGVSTSSETNTKDVSELAQYLGTHRVAAVFGETSVPSKGLQAVLDAVKKLYRYDVKLIGDASALYSDALGEVGSPGATYVGMIRHNMKVIVAALSTP